MELPKEVNVCEVLNDAELDLLFETIDTFLSDKYGYCITGYNLEIKATDIEWDIEE